MFYGAKFETRVRFQEKSTRRFSETYWYFEDIRWRGGGGGGEDRCSSSVSIQSSGDFADMSGGKPSTHGIKFHWCVPSALGL